jgi:hypothetical protein
LLAECFGPGVIVPPTCPAFWLEEESSLVYERRDG